MGLRDKIWCNLAVNGKHIKFEIDTGAPVTIMSVADAKKYFGIKLKVEAPDLELYSYCKTPIDCIGYMWVVVETTKKIKVKMYLVNSVRKPLLGRGWLRSIQLNWQLILKKKLRSSAAVNQIREVIEQEGKLRHVLEKYPEVFSTIPGKIMKVDAPEWATPVVVVRNKNNAVRLCGDYKVTLNPELLVDEHPLPTIDELFSSMAGGNKFSKIDLAKAYLQLKVHPEDQHLLTLNTHKGLYRPTRLMSE